MTIPEIPIAAIDAGASALFDTDRSELRGLSSIATGQAARIVLAAALPHLLPGMYVSGDGIWSEVDRPGLPVLMVRQHAAPELFRTLAALLPERSDDEED